jgi:cytochrome b6-f complex iron-sulfur subunit
MDQVSDMEGAACTLPSNLDPTSGETRGVQPSSALSRRSFIKMGLGALSTLALLEVGGAGMMFLHARSLDGEFGGVVTAGVLDDFPPGSVTELADSQFFLVRTADGGLLAIHRRCTHLGCTVNWVPAENHFVCPCHAAIFDFYGDFQNPPVPRPLDTFPIEIKDTQVLVDTSRPQRRETFKPEQLTYAPQGQLSKSS